MSSPEPTERSALLTVVILTYNSAATLQGCLSSLQAQSCQAFKVVIVDDDSTDSTMEIVDTFRRDGVLDISVLRNGSHNISRGRNIGLQACTTRYAAFIDSDAYAAEGWVASIMSEFQQGGKALLAGKVRLEHRNNLSRAIACNDDAIRDIFARGVLLLSSCNCALDREVLSEFCFDERFSYAEDLDFTYKVGKKHKWAVVDSMQVRHESRSSILGYHKQMLKYGEWKLFFAYRTKSYRCLDFVPLAFITGSLLLAFVNPWGLVLFPALCLLEAIVIVVVKRPPAKLWGPVLAGWCVKNTSWSLGTAKGIYGLLTSQWMRAMVSDTGSG